MFRGPPSILKTVILDEPFPFARPGNARYLKQLRGVADGISPIPDLADYQPIGERGLQSVDRVSSSNLA